MDDQDNPPFPEGGYGSPQEKIGAHVLHVQRRMLAEQRRNNDLVLQLLEELKSHRAVVTINALDAKSTVASADVVAEAIQRGISQSKPLKGNAQVRK